MLNDLMVLYDVRVCVCLSAYACMCVVIRICILLKTKLRSTCHQ